MSENPRRGRQARNFTTNVPKILDLKSSSEQIFFRKLSLGAPVSFAFSLDILASNKALVNLAMFTRGYLSKTPKFPPKPVALKLSSKSDSTLRRLIGEFNVN